LEANGISVFDIAGCSVNMSYCLSSEI